jgi:hypothetical protein
MCIFTQYPEPEVSLCRVHMCTNHPGRGRKYNTVNKKHQSFPDRMHNHYTLSPPESRRVHGRQDLSVTARAFSTEWLVLRYECKTVRTFGR